jgi:hypothetical protein
MKMRLATSPVLPRFLAAVVGSRCGAWTDPLKTLVACLVTVLLTLPGTGCGQKSASGSTAGVDPHLQTNGTIEVTAKLLEIPEGAIFQRELYDYATVLKYEIIRVHRGEVKGESIQESKNARTMIYVGQYNPFKPRNQAADSRVKQIGGNVREFRPGQVQRMAMEVPIEDFYMGGIVNKYFDPSRTTVPIYWAVWTNLE